MNLVLTNGDIIFDEWNEIKKKIDYKDKKVFIKEGNVYLVIIGKNVGSEVYGKGEFFLRPVLVLKKLSKYNFIGIPLTSKEKNGNYFFKFQYKQDKFSYALFNQIKTFDVKRIFKYHGSIKKKDFYILKQKLLNMFSL